MIVKLVNIPKKPTGQNQAKMSNFTPAYENIEIHRKPDHGRSEGVRGWQKRSGHMSGTEN